MCIRDRVETYEDFVAFAVALSNDFLANGSEWENDTVDSFLEAMASWNIEGYYANSGQVLPEQPNWKMFAQILIAAKWYE